MSIRKEKAAKLRIQVLEVTLQLIGKKSFDDLYVEQLCEKVNISKVTLFKYFPQKRDILMFYLRAWCLARSIELREGKKEGVQGLYFIFDRLAVEYERYPGIWLGLIAYLSDFSRPAKPFPVKMEERKLLHTDVADVKMVEILSIQQMVERFTLEAIFRKEITRSGSTSEIRQLILSTLYGSVLVAHIQQIGHIRPFFRQNIDLILKGLA